MCKTTPSKWAGKKWFATSGVMQWSLGGQDSPLVNGQDKSAFEPLESYT